MKIKLRIILDTDEDVLRDVELNATHGLTDLHNLVIDAFQLEKGELASFFSSNDDWEQGEEIGIVELSISGSDTTRTMSEFTIADFLTDTGDRMLYVYDYLNLWTFFIEVLSSEKGEINAPAILASVGERPTAAPEKEMKSENLDDGFNEDSDNFEEEDFDDANWY